jgi:hypothetical protein
MMTHGSSEHLEAPPFAPPDSVHTRGSEKPPMPGSAVIVVSSRQSRHMTVIDTGACFGLLAAVMMPGIITSWETCSDCITQSDVSTVAGMMMKRSATSLVPASSWPRAG